MARPYHLSVKGRRTKAKFLKQRHADPDFATKLSGAARNNMKRLNGDPEFTAKRKAALKRLYADPKYVAERAATMKRLFSDPKFVAKHAATHTKVTPEKREQILAAFRASTNPSLRQIAKAVGGISHETVRKVILEDRRT